MKLKICSISAVLTITAVALTSLQSAGQPPKGHGKHQATAAPKWEIHFPSGVSMVEIPFRDEENTILIDVRINGSDPVAFVVDTGTYDVVLMKSQKLEGVEIDFGDPGKDSNLARGLSFDMGTLRFEGAQMTVLPEETLKGLGTVSWDGILGAPFFASVVVEVDWKKSVLRLHDPSTFKVPDGAEVIPLDRRRGHIFMNSEVTIDGNSQSVDLVVDTGSTGALALRSDKVSVPARRVSDIVLARSLWGDITGDIGRIEGLKLGTSSLKGVVSIFVGGSSGIISVGSDGNLGVKVLRRFGVTFDYTNNRMLLTPTKAIGDPFPFSTSGVQVARHISDDGALKILSVYANSPGARAGLAPGDRILSLNSKPVDELGVETVRSLLRQTPGNRVVLEIRKTDASLEVELELETIL